MTLRTRFVRAFGLMATLVLFCGALGAAGVISATQTMEEMGGRVQPMRLANSQLQASVTDASRGLRGYLLTGEQRFLESYTRGRVQFDASLAQLDRLAAPDEQASVELLESRGEAWFALYTGQDLLRTFNRGVIGRGQELVEELLRGGAALDDLLRIKQEDLEERGSTLRRDLLIAVSAVALLGMAMAVAVGLRLARAVGSPLVGLVDTLDRLATGDATARAQTPSSAAGEIAVVARSINAMAEEKERRERNRAERAWVRELARDVGLHVRNYLDRSEVTTEGVKAIAEALSAEAVTLCLIGPAGLAPVRHWEAGELVGDPAAATTETLAATGSQDRGPDWLEGLYASARATPLIDEPGAARALTGMRIATPPDDQGLTGRSAKEYDDRAAFVAAVGTGTEVAGLLVVRLAEPENWTEPAAEFLESVAADLGRALHHALLYSEQNRVIAQLRELDEIKSEFLSTVSHELRTPLTSIAGYTELLAEGDGGPISDEQGRMLEVIDRNTARLKSLIEDLLTLSRMEVGAYSVDYEPVAVAELIARVQVLLPALLHGRDLTVHVDPGPDGSLVLGDMGALERVLINLLSNAVKFTPTAGTVSLRAGVSGGSLFLGVSDTGMGIPEEEQQRLFTRFFRASNASAAAVQGTGLGLSIVHTIVEQHGGSIRLRSKEGVGTTVEVRLPLLRQALAGMPSPGPAFFDVVHALSASLPVSRSEAG